MRTTWEGRIDGDFHGYKSGRVYALSDGSRWKQEDSTDEPVYRNRPTARLLIDGTGRTFLDVEGTSAVVLVVPDEGMRGPSVGAF